MENNNIENKPEYKPEYKPEPKKKNWTLLYGAIAFIVVFFVGGAIIQYIFTYAFASSAGLDFNDVLKASASTSEYSTDVINAAIKSVAWSNFITYLLTFIAMFIIFRKRFIDNFKEIIKFFKEKDKKRIIIFIVTIIGFVALSFLIDFIFSKFSKSSENQSLIEMILKSDCKVLMIIPTVIFAPIVEELFYRAVVFSFCKKYSMIFAYVISSLVFALPHMLSTPISSEWAIQLLPYLLSGALLCFVYDINKENIYSSITAHMINNLFAVIFVFI